MIGMTRNQVAKDFRAGKTFWRCMPYSNGQVSISEVLLQGSIRHRQDTKCTQRSHGRWVDNFLTDLAGHGLAQCFNTRRRAERFAAEYQSAAHPLLLKEALKHESRNRSFDEWMVSYGEDDYADDEY